MILPAAAGVTAAIGLLAAEVRFDVARTFVRRLDALDPAQLEAMYAEMTGQAVDVVRDSAGGGGVTIVRSVDARYVGQGYELTVPVPAGALDAAALARIRKAFDEIYAARYGYAQPNEPVEVVTWKLSAIGGAPRIALPKTAAGPVERRAQGPAARVLPRDAAAGSIARSTIATRSRPACSSPARPSSRSASRPRCCRRARSATVDEYANLIVEVGAR